MEIKTSDLITLQNHARAFKQNDFIFYNHKLYNTLDSNIFAVTTFVPIEFSEPMIINYRQLNAFMKTITIETKFEFQYSKNSRYIINTSGDILNIEEPSQYTMSLLYNRVDYINKLSMNTSFYKCGDVTEELENAFTYKKADGTYPYIKNINGNNFYMTLFSSIFPLNKTDKIDLEILDLPETNTFVSKFGIIKKKSNITIYIYIHFIKV